MFKNQDIEEREKLIEQRWQQKMNNALQAKVQVYSSSFEMDPNLTAEQQDLYRLKTKIKEPYSYF